VKQYQHTVLFEPQEADTTSSCRRFRRSARLGSPCKRPAPWLRMPFGAIWKAP